MPMRTIFAAMLCCLLVVMAHAESVRVEFALPEKEGRISLGVFDAKGTLVRNLFTLATEEDFKIGLNGLITSWDGLDDAGKSLPPGKYYARGFVVGPKAESEGVAFHFNDWITDEDSPRFSSIRDFARYGGEFVLLASRMGALQAARYDAEGKLLWDKQLFAGRLFTRELAVTGMSVATPHKDLVASDEARVPIYSFGSLEILDAKTGEKSQSADSPAKHVSAIALEGARLTLACGTELYSLTFPLDQKSTPSIVPEPLTALADGKDGLLLGAATGVFAKDGEIWKKLPIDASVTSLSWGMDGSIWLTGKVDDKAVAGQFGKDGEFLRQYHGDLPPVKIQASDSEEEIMVLEEDAKQQRFRILRLRREGEASNWEILLERSIEYCAKFGIVGGKLVADAGDAAPQDEFHMRADSGGLTTKGSEMTLRAVAGKDALWLEDKSGLKLVQVAEQSAPRVAVAPGDAVGTLKVYVGDDSVVSEFLVTGLLDISSFDAGEIDLP